MWGDVERKEVEGRQKRGHYRCRECKAQQSRPGQPPRGITAHTASSLCKHGVLVEAQQLGQLQEDCSQGEHVDLQGVAEVDEEEGLGVLAAHQVQGCGSHLVGAPPAGEAVLQRELVQPVGCSTRAGVVHSGLGCAAR